MKMHDDDDDDQLSVPAEPGRVIIGLMMMTAGVFIAALIGKSWAKGLGLALFILSPFVMLKSPRKTMAEAHWFASQRVPSAKMTRLSTHSALVAPSGR